MCCKPRDQATVPVNCVDGFWVLKHLLAHTAPVQTFTCIPIVQFNAEVGATEIRSLNNISISQTVQKQFYFTQNVMNYEVKNCDERECTVCLIEIVYKNFKFC